MFKKLAMQYYAEEEVSDTLQEEIEECYYRSKAFLSSETKCVIDTTHSFHDWYLIECSTYCDYDAKYCRLTLSKHCITYYILFSGVTSISIVGELVSDEAKYPESDLNFSLAQVLTLWLDYRKSFEFCLLLDNERYVTIQADGLDIYK